MGSIAEDTENERVLESTLNRPFQMGKMTPDETGSRKESVMPAGTQETFTGISRQQSDLEHFTTAPRSDSANTQGSVNPPDSQSMPFRSILFLEPEPEGNLDGSEEPAVFSDLNLNQVVAAVTANRAEYNLKPFFYFPLRSVDAVYYRYEVLRDLDDLALIEHIRSFAEAMQHMRASHAQQDKLFYKRQKQSWFLNSVDTYCGAVRRLCHALTHKDLSSRGFRGLRGYLTNYVESEAFRALFADTQKLKADLAAITYSIQISNRRITVSDYRSEPDYGADVLQTFEKFSQGAARQYKFKLCDTPDMNHIEATILDMVEQLYPEAFSFLEEYCNRNKDHLDSVISTFDREVQFYLAWIEYMQRFKQAGLACCYPSISDQSKEVCGRSVFDLALASRLIVQHDRVVTNDFFLRDHERIFIVSGPNQGGKTTFARTFGQLHYLAAIGCPVPGSEARLFFFDRLFTHFEKEEDIENGTGKLEDELIRIHRILEYATPNSILIMNESFLSTTLSDALFLSRQIMQKIIALDMLCISVTFIDELAAMSNTTVSMVSTVDLRNPTLRTFKVVRRPADGLAYAVAIAENYCLTHGLIKTRILTNVKEDAAR